MSEASTPPSPGDFLTVAVNLRFLSDSDRREFESEGVALGISPRDVAIEQGRLDAVAVDIITTLLHPETTIPGYSIESLLGRGGMGVVYRALQKNLNRPVALKTILVGQKATRSVLDRFEKEAKTVGLLRHPNIIAAHDFGRAEGRLYFVMELVEGVDLLERLKLQGAISESIALAIVRQAVSGLLHADEHNIVHRDIKPANLMLLEPPPGYPLPPNVPLVKVADFGLALLTKEAEIDTRLTAESTTVGSPHYMAPEQLQSSEVDQRADIYSLGATLYHMLAGMPPFEGMNLPQVVAAKLGNGPTPLKDIAPQVSESTLRLVNWLMSRDPKDRPQNYHTLLSSLDQEFTTMVETLHLPTEPNGRHQNARTIETALLPTEPRETTNVAETSPLPTLPQSKGRSQMRAVGRHFSGWLMAAALCVMLGTLIWWIEHSSADHFPQTPVAMQTAGFSHLLFDGNTITGWTVRSGTWRPRPQHAVIVGSNGLISRTLFIRGDDNTSDVKPRAPEWFQLEVGLQPLSKVDEEEGQTLDWQIGSSDKQTRSQEIHFGLESVQGRNGKRWIIRRSSAGIEIGSAKSDDAPFIRNHSIPHAPVLPNEPQSIMIRRVPNGWFVSVGETQIASMPLHTRAALPEFRLASQAGPVGFSDIYFSELIPVAE
ncbi:MAG: serine/threonine-protein kinase [Planctomycetaceae bacterium]